MKIKYIIATLGILFTTNTYADSYGRLYGGYSLLSLESSKNPSHGAHIGWIGLLNVTKGRLPLYFQYGAEGIYVTNREKDKYKEKFLSMGVPLSLAYRFNCGNTKIEPFVGPNIRVNLVGKCEWENDKNVDYLSDLTGRQVQFGMNVGLGFSLNRFYLGYRLNPDFTHYFNYEDSKSLYQHLSIGVNF